MGLEGPGLNPGQKKKIMLSFFLIFSDCSLEYYNFNPTILHKFGFLLVTL